MVGVAIGVRERPNVLLHMPGCDVVLCGLSRRAYDTTGCTPLIPPGCSPFREPAHRCKDRKKVVQAAEELQAHQRGQSESSHQKFSPKGMPTIKEQVMMCGNQQRKNDIHSQM